MSCVATLPTPADADTERYWAKLAEARTQRDAALRRWPRLCAHVICRSLGYATPNLAARILVAVKKNEPCYCEWLGACYKPAYNPVPCVQEAIRHRHSHRVYMADYGQALAIVKAELDGLRTDPLCQFASWF